MFGTARRLCARVSLIAPFLTERVEDYNVTLIHFEVQAPRFRRAGDDALGSTRRVCYGRVISDYRSRHGSHGIGG
jgi:hypothetical protein